MKPLDQDAKMMRVIVEEALVGPTSV